ncbi:MAG: M14-type cytosolic carboxypeptidase [Sandaracinaceae bacterium]
MSLRVSSAFDGGNGALVDAPDDNTVCVQLSRDAGDRFMQWFYFRVTGAGGRDLTVRIVNARDVSYARGYVDYRAVASRDRKTWRRVETSFEDGELVVRYPAAPDSVYFAYFVPYSMERHADRVAGYARDPRVALEVVGSTLDGQDLDLVRFGRGPRVIWAIARQHPGETMAEHFMDGFVDRLLDEHDAVSARLHEAATFFVVPNMNPDGSRRGYLRTNASGANLNREWLEPTLERSPEVHAIRERMRTTGVDLCLDVHGEEELPYNFIAGPDGIPGLTTSQVELLRSFRASLARLNPDFQTERGYPPAARGDANLTMCTNWVAENFGCLAMTLEQPFKDAANRPMPDVGWCPERARRLAASTVDAIASVVDVLRR